MCFELSRAFCVRCRFKSFGYIVKGRASVKGYVLMEFYKSPHYCHACCAHHYSPLNSGLVPDETPDLDCIFQRICLRRSCSASTTLSSPHSRISPAFQRYSLIICRRRPNPVKAPFLTAPRKDRLLSSVSFYVELCLILRISFRCTCEMRLMYLSISASAVSYVPSE